ncbi:MAG: chloride channel protein [Flavobacteriales bacterium]|nr:chloride channel protein [Flavobacteriales bacterium]MCB9448305.1 chloride channel protein [Flavobacteriales bacterium]
MAEEPVESIARKKSLLTRFLIWRVRHIKQRNFIILLSVVVGFATGLSAVFIKNTVYVIRNLLTSGFTGHYQNYLYFAYPLIGLLLTVTFIKYVLRKPIGHGIPNTLYSISKNNSILPSHTLFSSMITSAFTVGFGGSVGLEGPSVSTGASIGSNLGRVLHLNYKSISLLIGCGVAGAMSSIFNCPIAAIVFAIEVIMLDLTMSSLIPLLISSASAALTSMLLMESEVIFHYEFRTIFTPKVAPFYIILGLLTGLLSVYFSKVFWWIEERFESNTKYYKKALIGGLILGLLIFFFPPLYGEGYNVVNDLFTGNYQNLFSDSLFYEFHNNIYIVILFMLAVLFLKVIASSVTFGGGGVGGIFAPALFMGALGGFIFSTSVNNLTYFHLETSNFILVGMAGLIAGVLQAPLTAIFMIAEITGGYGLFLPLMVTSSISYVTVKTFIPHSVYNMQLAKRGELITHHKDKAVLNRLQVDQVIENDFESIHPKQTLGELVKVVARSHRNIFPVVNKAGEMVGVVLLNDIREIMFQPEKYDKITVETLMDMPPAYIKKEDSMEKVANTFADTGAWNLPVISKEGKYLGFISRSKLFSAYRRQLVEFSED